MVVVLKALYINIYSNGDSIGHDMDFDIIRDINILF